MSLLARHLSRVVETHTPTIVAALLGISLLGLTIVLSVGVFAVGFSLGVPGIILSFGVALAVSGYGFVCTLETVGRFLSQIEARRTHTATQ